MSIPPVRRQALTIESLIKLLDPHRVFYRPVIIDTLEHGDLAEINALIASAKDLKEHYKDFDGLIHAAESAARKAQAQ